MAVLGFAHLTYSACATIAERFYSRSQTAFRRVPNALEKRDFLGQTAVSHDIFLFGVHRQIEVVVYDDTPRICYECRKNYPIIRDNLLDSNARLSVSSKQITTLEAIGLREVGKRMILPGLPGQPGLEIVRGSTLKCATGKKHGLAGIALYLRPETAAGFKERLTRGGFLLSGNFSLHLGSNRFDIFLGRRRQLTLEFLSRSN